MTVNNTEALLNKLYRQQEKRPAVEDVLLGDSWWPYMWYRLRLFITSKGIGIILYFAELFLIYNLVHQEEFFKLALLRIFVGWAESAWWGFAEGLRSDIRRELELFRLVKIQRTINCWFSWATLISSVIIGGAFIVLCCGFLFNNTSENDFFWCYLFCLLFKLSISIMGRVVHGSVYGYSRIYRPMWSIICPDIIWLFSLLLLWPLCELNSLLFAIILSASASTLLTIHYCRPVYERMKVEFPRASIHYLHTPKTGPQLGHLLSAISSAAMRIASIFVFGFFSVENTGDIMDYQRGMVTFYLYLFGIFTIPLLDIAVSWSTLFYFDFKKYESPVYKDVYKRLVRMTNYVSYSLGLALWILALLFGWYFLDQHMIFLLVSSFFFFTLRSRLGTCQMRAFCEQRYGTIIISSLILGFAMWIINNIDIFYLPRDLAFGAILGGTILFIELSCKFITKDTDLKREIPYSKWLDRLQKALDTRPNSELKILIFDFDLSFKQPELVIQQLADRMPIFGSLTIIGNSRGLYFNQNSPNFPWTFEQLGFISGGAIKNIRVVTLQGTFDSHHNWPWLSRDLAPSLSEEEITEYIKKNYPEAVIIDLSVKFNKELQQFNSTIRHSILKSSYKYVMYDAPQHIKNYLVCAVAPHGLLKKIIIFPKRRINLVPLTLRLRRIK